MRKSKRLENCKLYFKIHVLLLFAFYSDHEDFDFFFLYVRTDVGSVLALIVLRYREERKRRFIKTLINSASFGSTVHLFLKFFACARY